MQSIMHFHSLSKTLQEIGPHHPLHCLGDLQPAGDLLAQLQPNFTAAVREYHPCDRDYLTVLRLTPSFLNPPHWFHYYLLSFLSTQIISHFDHTNMFTCFIPNQPALKHRIQITTTTKTPEITIISPRQGMDCQAGDHVQKGRCKSSVVYLWVSNNLSDKAGRS